jgi:hypothetical protein
MHRNGIDDNNSSLCSLIHMRNQNILNFTSLLISISIFFSATYSFAQPIAVAPSSVTKKNASFVYQGTLVVSEAGLFLKQLESNVLIELTFQDPSSAIVLRRLSQGDFVSLQAIKATPIQVVVTSINYIGLVSLLGTWLGDDNVCYYFRSFTSFLIFNPDTNGACTLSPSIDEKKSRRMSYFITPDDKDWFLLISDKSAQYAAELIIKNSKTIQLNLFDEQTGDILSKVILRR